MEDVTFAQKVRLLTREQKISVGILGVCGIFAVGLSLLRVQSIISDPFTVSKAELASAKRTVNTIDRASAAEAKARRIDTDGDGLSDWDEEQIYHTSAYLRDTDGDSMPDNTELAQKTDPTCPQGKSCTPGSVDASALATSTFLFTNPNTYAGATDNLFASFQRGMNQQKLVLTQQGATGTFLQQGLVRDAKEIRRVIIESGKIDPSIIEGLSDAQLLELYDQAQLELAKKELDQQTGGSQDPSQPISPELSPSP